MITDQHQTYLETVRIPIRLSCLTESGWPLVLSLWYLPRQGRLYCATQAGAKVVGYLRRDPRCAFEVAADEPPYCGLRGQGRVTIDSGQGAEILEQLLIRYLGDADNPLAQKLLANSASEVALIIEPTHIFTWDYSKRMANSIDIDNEAQSKPCP